MGARNIIGTIAKIIDMVNMVDDMVSGGVRHEEPITQTKNIPMGIRSSLIDNVLKNKVTPVEGSIVCCDLGVALEHSGVYIGSGKIAHRDGDGYLAIVTPREFIDRLNGWNNAISIYVSCRGGNAIGSKMVAERAKKCVSEPDHQGYHLLEKNCHHFCQYCLTKKEPDISSCTFESLEDMLVDVYKTDNWRVWDI
ncbi:hypothetical protein AGMMS50276_06870 [Synergistales bacterium]|nr:hypothetical protein AGMMS50276_06870 [Synergistales bacterium]